MKMIQTGNNVYLALSGREAGGEVTNAIFGEKLWMLTIKMQ